MGIDDDDCNAENSGNHENWLDFSLTQLKKDEIERVG